MDYLNSKILIPVFCLTVALYGFFNFATDYEANACNMTYMFEYPEYIKIRLKHGVAEKFPRYSLYVYGEGKYAQELWNNKITGIPVLFIPGNAGSHRQVRSVASVAMRMGHTLHKPFHFDVFAISFREELSGFYGGILEEQIEFVHECVRTITSLYSKNKTLILIGHSMGGVIARALFSVTSFDSSTVSIIFTLAAPHKHPVVALDYEFINIYNKISVAWNRHAQFYNTIPVISIGGGQRDFLITSELTSFEKKMSSLHFHAVTTAIPGVWCSIDHLAIVWCKELILTLARAMFDLIDSKTKQVTNNLMYSQKVLYHHFIQQSYKGHFSSVPVIPMRVFPASGDWIYQEEPSWKFSRNKVLSAVYILIPLVKGESLVVITTGMGKLDWIFGCSSKVSKHGGKACNTGINLSHQGKVIPSRNMTYERRMFNLASSELIQKGLTGVVVHIAPMNSQVDVLGERYNHSQRNQHIQLLPLAGRLLTYAPVRIASFAIADEAIFFNYTISGLGRIIDSATLFLETRICKAGSVVGQGIMNLHIPWSREDQLHHIRTSLGGITSIPVKLHLLPPKGVNQDIQLHVILDPDCTYVLFVSYPILNVISQFFKFYALQIPGYVVALLLSVLSGQFYALGSKGTCPSASYILWKFPTFISLVILPSILYCGIWDLGFGPNFLPIPDDIALEESSLYYLLILRSILYLVAYGIVSGINFIFEKTIIFMSHTCMWISQGIVLWATETPLNEAQKYKLQAARFNLFACGIIQGTVIGIASSLGITVGSIVHFWKLVLMCIRCQAEEERRGPSAATTKWHLHSVLNILWMCCTLLIFPGTLTWAQHVVFAVRLVNDPYKLPSAIMMVATAFIWQMPVPVSSRLFYHAASHVIHFLAVLVTLYGMQSAYNLINFICLAIVTVFVHQLIVYRSELNRGKVE